MGLAEIWKAGILQRLRDSNQRQVIAAFHSVVFARVVLAVERKPRRCSPDDRSNAVLVVATVQ